MSKASNFSQGKKKSFREAVVKADERGLTIKREDPLYRGVKDWAAVYMSQDEMLKLARDLVGKARALDLVDRLGNPEEAAMLLRLLERAAK